MNLFGDYPLWTAIVTPFNEDGSIDYTSLESLLKKQEDAKNAVVILGSTGEALALGLKERKEVVEFALSLNLNVPLMAGVGGIHLPETTEWVEYLNTQKLDAYLLVSPLYAKPGEKGQTAWFGALLDTATKPCMLYNVPSRTGSPLNVESVRKLNEHKNFAAIKEASGSVEKFQEYIAAANGRPVLSGDDALTPAFCAVGGKGLVSVAANVWPKETHKFVRDCLSGKLTNQGLWEKATNSLFNASNPIPAKALLHKKEWIKTPTLRAPLTIEDMQGLEEVANYDIEIQSWYQEQ